MYKALVGETSCKKYLTVKHPIARWIPEEPNRYWSMNKSEPRCIYHEGYGLYECAEKGGNPFWGIKEISQYWESPMIIKELS